LLHVPVMIASIVVDMITKCCNVLTEDAGAGAGAGAETTPGADGGQDTPMTTDTPPTTSDENTEKTTIPDELPFQLQIRYTDAEGMKALRVLTQTRPVTHDRNLAEDSEYILTESIPFRQRPLVSAQD